MLSGAKNPVRRTSGIAGNDQTRVLPVLEPRESARFRKDFGLADRPMRFARRAFDVAPERRFTSFRMTGEVRRQRRFLHSSRSGIEHAFSIS